MSRDKVFDFAYISEKLGIGAVSSEWKSNWELSMEVYSNEGMYFLESDYINEANKILSLEEEALKVLQNTAAAIAGEPCLCALAWHCRCLLLAAQEKNELLSTYFPAFTGYHSEINDLFYAIVLIASLEQVVRLHERRGIPRQVTNDTLGDLGLWMRHFYQENGRWGLGEHEWLVRHFTGRLYRLGRLQFAYGTLEDDIHVFRNINHAKVIALCGPEVNYRGDGLIDGTNTIYASENVWVSRYDTNREQILGNPISPYGRALRTILKLEKEEWMPALTKGCDVLEVHIPEGESISSDLCGGSFEMAMELLPKCFPERTFKAFTCNTWLLDINLQELLPSYSNIIRFQREFYIYPVLGSDKQTFERVFGKKPDDLNTAPRDTSMRRAVLDYYAEGGCLSNMAGFILREDLSWGSEDYQKSWEELKRDISLPIEEGESEIINTL